MTLFIYLKAFLSVFQFFTGSQFTKPSSLIYKCKYVLFSIHILDFSSKKKWLHEVSLTSAHEKKSQLSIKCRKIYR